MTSRSQQWGDLPLQIRNFNDDFLLIEAEDESSVTALGKQLYAAELDFVEEVIVTEKEICLQLNERFDPAATDWLKGGGEAFTQESRTYELPVYFSEHEDWEGVMATTGLSKKAIIDQLVSLDFSIAMFGFLPGFLYLNGLPAALQVPRKTVPAKYVEANSIALGGRYIGLYALDSPGGWHVIGKLAIPVLQIPLLPPLPVNLGDTLRFRAISQAEYDELQAHPLSLIEYNA